MRICKNCNLILKKTDYICPKCDKETVEVDPEKDTCAYNVGSIYEGNDMLDEAAVWYRIALDKKPDEENYKMALDRINALLAAKQQMNDAKLADIENLSKTQNPLPIIRIILITNNRSF